MMSHIDHVYSSSNDSDDYVNIELEPNTEIDLLKKTMENNEKLLHFLKQQHEQFVKELKALRSNRENVGILLF